MRDIDIRYIANEVARQQKAEAEKYKDKMVKHFTRLKALSLASTRLLPPNQPKFLLGRKRCPKCGNKLTEHFTAHNPGIVGKDISANYFNYTCQGCDYEYAKVSFAQWQWQGGNNAKRN